MTLAVKVVLRHVIARIADASVQDARARYDLGHVLHLLRYGDSVKIRIAHLAAWLDVDCSALHRCARVSEAICPAEFDWLMSLRTEKGMPLTWSHIEPLAHERSASRRALLAEYVVREQISVRDLKTTVRRKRRPPVQETVSKSAKALPARIDRRGGGD
jgi:hypothetical protein